VNQKRNRLDVVVGLALLGSSITGVVSIVAALFPFVNGDHVAVGLCLIAAAISFGLLSIAILRP
jgi:hypothetical protein